MLNSPHFGRCLLSFFLSGQIALGTRLLRTTAWNHRWIIPESLSRFNTVNDFALSRFWWKWSQITRTQPKLSFFRPKNFAVRVQDTAVPAFSFFRFFHGVSGFGCGAAGARFLLLLLFKVDVNLKHVCYVMHRFSFRTKEKHKWDLDNKPYIYIYIHIHLILRCLCSHQFWLLSLLFVRILLGLRTLRGHRKWTPCPKRRLYDRICASYAHCSLHAMRVCVLRQENQCREAGLQRIASQIAWSLFACPSQDLIAREDFLDWLQSGVEASTALSEWTGGAGVVPSPNACRCLR